MSARLARVVLSRLTDHAAVYTRATAGAGGGMTVLVTADLPCRVLHIDPTGAPTSRDRTELAAMRQLLFDLAYTLPPVCVLEIRGQRWQATDARTIATERDLEGTPMYSSVDLVRADQP